jgi:hypothetical protein
LTPPAHQQRAANIMTPGGFGNPPVLAKAFFNNANLLLWMPLGLQGLSELLSM